MSRPSPAISIVTPARNAVATLGSCIASVRRQTIAAEHVVRDGGSTDGTRELLEREAMRAPVAADGYRLLYRSEPDAGMYDAINKGIESCTGDVIAVLNADDEYADERALDRASEALSVPGVVACYGDVVYVDAGSGRIVRTWRGGACGVRRFYWGWMPPHPTFFVRRELYEKHGRYRLDLGTAADYELMLRMLVRHREPAVYVPDLLVRMRTGGLSNRSLAARIRANLMDRRAWAVNGLRPFPWTLWLKPLRKLRQFRLLGLVTDGGDVLRSLRDS